MATRGRKPKPPELKVLGGERAGRRDPAPPAPRPGRPECPGYLDDDAKEEWSRIASELEAIALLTLDSRALLTLYCNAFSRWMRARGETLDVVGSTDLGSLKANPAVAVEKDAEAMMLRILAELGLTPASRHRVRASDPGRKDELGEFLARRRAK
jgi:P27 family predicted phage terminase small subunit